mmetsp:Transcript_53199/g.78974  ORF Transcript_53199/g.78974 Transcript_53199/m.78974 type:complete len:423 (+) Transcript_53199:745-2013(+)
MHNTGSIQVLSEHLQKFTQFHWLLLREEGDSLVVKLLVANLGRCIQEVLEIKANGRVIDHGLQCLVEVLGEAVQENSLGPVAALGASSQHLRHLEALGVSLDVVHQGRGAVLRVHDSEGAEDALVGVGLLKQNAFFQEHDEFLVVAKTFVSEDELVQVIGLDDDVQTRNAGEVEFLVLHAGLVDLLPGEDTVGLLGGVDSILELGQGEVARGEALVVADVGEQQLGCLVHLVVEQAVSANLNARDVGLTDELLEIAEALASRQGVDDFGVDGRLLHLAASHGEVLDKLVVAFGTVGSLNDGAVVGRILCRDVTLNAVSDEAVLELCRCQLAPHGGFLHAFGELLGTFDGMKTLKQDADGLQVVIELLVDEERLFVELVLLLQSNGSDLSAVEFVEAVDEVLDTVWSGTNGSHKQQVLQVGVL